MLVQGTNVEVSFDPDVNPNTPITVNTRASRKSILNLISSLTHYGLTPDQDSLTVGYYQTETFVLTIPSGANSAQQGSQSEESSSDDEGDTSTTKVDGQYITTVYNNTEITTEIAKAVEAVLKMKAKMMAMSSSVRACGTRTDCHHRAYDAKSHGAGSPPG